MSELLFSTFFLNFEIKKTHRSTTNFNKIHKNLHKEHHEDVVN